MRTTRMIRQAAASWRLVAQKGWRPTRAGLASVRSYSPATANAAVANRGIKSRNGASSIDLIRRPSITKDSRHRETAIRTLSTLRPVENAVHLTVDGTKHAFSPVLLRDLDESPRNVDASTKQKLVLTTDIPGTIRAREIEQNDQGVTIQWENNVPGHEDEATFIQWDVLRALASSGIPNAPTMALEDLPKQVLWDARGYSEGIEDIEYEAYMQDDRVLYAALQQLHTYGLLFLRNVPESEKSVSTIAERIGPIKNTFYGYTWDVRSVPEAKNVAYTSQDLRFHMDLLYMAQPPHLQLLHCIRSSSEGGASLFTDSYRSAADLFASSPAAFAALANLDVHFHYNHPTSHLYHQARQVFELKQLSVDGVRLRTLQQIVQFLQSEQSAGMGIWDFLDAVSWSPMFQAPFAFNSLPRTTDSKGGRPGPSPADLLSRQVEQWHAAASEFNALIHRTEAMYERMMKPGECVIFDNRRVLHARRAFHVADVGKERWLRGTYLDKDPYLSKVNVLRRKLEG